MKIDCIVILSERVSDSDVLLGGAKRRISGWEWNSPSPNLSLKGEEKVYFRGNTFREVKNKILWQK